MRAAVVLVVSAVGATLTCSGCSTPLTSESYMRLSVASPGGYLGPVKSPFEPGCVGFENGQHPLYVRLDPGEAPLSIERVDSISREMHDCASGFAAGYRAHEEGYDPRLEVSPTGMTIRWNWPDSADDVQFQDAWSSAFASGWHLAREEAIENRGLAPDDFWAPLTEDDGARSSGGT